MHLPTALALVMIVSTMIGAGLQVDRARLTATLRRYDLLGKALLGNFVVVPFVAWLAVRAFGVGPELATGILLMAMAPGVPFLVNSAGRQQGGSLSFAVEIAFLFSALSVVTIPITAGLLLPGGALAIPTQRFLTTLIGFQLVPLLIGAAIGPRLSEAVVEKTTRVLHLIFAVTALVFAAVLSDKIVAAVASVYGFGHLAAIAVIGLCALLTGWVLGGPHRDDRRTLSIATLMRNIGLCALIATSEFPNTPVVPAVITYFAITFAISLPIRIYFHRTRDAAPLSA
jgi:BASS family bile acid:Na+ symporter